nr:OPT/YSL family transporter [Calditrichia bacterium]
MSSNKSALTLRAALIASFLSLFLLASTSYIALKIGAAPWPVIFSVVVSGGLLKLLDRGRKTDIHEVNVAQAGASIGGLVAAGVSFTIPGIIFLQQAGQTDLQIPDLLPLSLLCVGAAVLGILLAIPMKATFVDEEQLPYPAGTAGAELLKLGKTGGRELRLITALGASAALFALLRDVYFPAGFALSFLVPAGIFITLLPMPLAIGSGYILGPRASFSWMGGAAVGWLIIVPLLVNNGMAAATAPVWVQNLGMGMVLGSGVGFFLSYVVPRIKRIFGPFFDARSNGKWWISLAVLPAVAILLWTGVPPLAVFITLAGTWMMVAVAAR